MYHRAREQGRFLISDGYKQYDRHKNIIDTESLAVYPTAISHSSLKTDYLYLRPWTPWMNHEKAWVSNVLPFAWDCLRGRSLACFWLWDNRKYVENFWERFHPSWKKGEDPLALYQPSYFENFQVSMSYLELKQLFIYNWEVKLRSLMMKFDDLRKAKLKGGKNTRFLRYCWATKPTLEATTLRLLVN